MSKPLESKPIERCEEPMRGYHYALRSLYPLMAAVTGLAHLIR